MLHWKSPWQWHGSAAFTAAGFGATETPALAPDERAFRPPARAFPFLPFFGAASSSVLSSSVAAADDAADAAGGASAGAAGAGAAATGGGGGAAGAMATAFSPRNANTVP